MPASTRSNVLTMRGLAAGDALRRRRSAPRSSTRALQRIRALPGVQAAATIDDLPFEAARSADRARKARRDCCRRIKPTVQVRKITPGYLARCASRCCAAATSPTATRRAARQPRGRELFWADDDPIGRRAALPLIRGPAQRGRRDRRRREAGRPGGERGRRPSTSTRATHMAQRAFAIRTSVPPATLAQPAAGVRSTRSIRSSRSRTSARWSRCATRRHVAAIQRAAARPVSRGRAGCSPRSASTASCRTSRAAPRNRHPNRARRAHQRRAPARRPRRHDAALVGIAFGAIAALAAARLLETMVFGISASDPLTLAAVAAVLAAVSLVASLLPGCRAAQSRSIADSPRVVAVPRDSGSRR